MISLRATVAGAPRHDRLGAPVSGGVTHPYGAGRALFRTFFAQFFASESVASDI